MNSKDAKNDSTEDSSLKKPYASPTITPQGRVEDLTQWIGGQWGEFFNGQGSGWNPWKTPGGS